MIINTYKIYRMFIVLRCHDVDGEMEYQDSSVIGIYDDITKAKNDLKQKFVELKYKYDEEYDDPEYYFVFVDSIKGKVFDGPYRLCFEIKKKNLKTNEIKMKS